MVNNKHHLHFCFKYQIGSFKYYIVVHNLILSKNLKINLDCQPVSNSKFLIVTISESASVYSWKFTVESLQFKVYNLEYLQLTEQQTS